MPGRFATRFTRRRALAGATALAALTAVVFLPALWNGFIWDDDQYVTENLALRSLDGLRRIWVEPGAVPQYYPLTFTTFWIEHHLWGATAAGYHAVNILLQAAAAILFWVLLRRLRVPGAWAAAALFAIHPIQVESVVWITERKNLLSGVLFFGAILAYLRSDPPEDAPPEVLPRAPYLLSTGLLAGALLSKTVTCSMPAVVLLLLWWKRGTLHRRSVLRLLPLFAIGLAMAGVTVWMERSHVGAQGFEFALPPLDRVLVAGRALWFYVWTIFWPANLTFVYPRWTVDATVWWQYAFPAAALGVLVALLLALRRLGRGPLVAALCYGGMLTPALGFIDVFPMRYSFVADHFAYLPVAAVFALVAATGQRLFARGPTFVRRYAAPALVASTVVVLGLVSWRQTAVYRNLRTLWTETIARNPGAWMAHNNLGSVLYMEERDVDGAIRHLTESIRLNPDNYEGHNNLGLLRSTQGAFAEAEAHLREAIRLAPGFAAAHRNLGMTLGSTGRYEEAAAYLAEAVRIEPGDAEAHYSLGVTRTRQGRLPEAIPHYRAAIRLQPGHAGARNNLAFALIAQDNPDEALVQLREAIRLRPAFPEAYFNLGNALLALGRVAEGIAALEAALRLRPDYPEARTALERARGRRAPARIPG